MNSFLSDKNYILLTYAVYIASNLIVIFYKTALLIAIHINSFEFMNQFKLLYIITGSIQKGLKLLMPIAFIYSFRQRDDLLIKINFNKIKFLTLTNLMDYILFVPSFFLPSFLTIFHGAPDVDKMVYNVTIFMLGSSFIFLFFSIVFLVQFLKRK